MAKTIVQLGRPTQAEQLAQKCKHFTGVMDAACAAGVEYATVSITHPQISYRRGTGAIYQTTRSLPCVDSLNLGGATCEKRCVRTADEIAADVAESDRAIRGVFTARDAIVKATDGKRGVGGTIPCPVCTTGTLGYSVAGSNGHIHARCSTEGCVAWME